MKTKFFLGGVAVIIVIAVVFASKTNLFKGMLAPSQFTASQPSFSFVNSPSYVLPPETVTSSWRITPVNNKTPFSINSVCVDMNYNKSVQLTEKHFITESHFSGQLVLSIDGVPAVQRAVDASLVDGVCEYITLPQLLTFSKKPSVDVKLSLNLSSTALLEKSFTPIVGIKFDASAIEAPSNAIHIDLPAKPRFIPRPDSPSGLQSAGAYKELAKFYVRDLKNPHYFDETSFELKTIDIKLEGSGVNVMNLKLYPPGPDSNAVTGIKLSPNSVRFNMLSNPLIREEGFNIISKLNPQYFSIRGDVVATAQGGKIKLGIASLDSAGTNWRGGTSLGNGDSAPDIEWTSSAKPGIFFWTAQSSPVYLNSAPLIYGSASGTLVPGTLILED